ncbi:MAG: RIP metalloprotease RseP [Bdellovibrionota bacterium]|nr:RIP metalloprotease RseP [Pseudobdellovibrionaceae bacterium]|tara:strand:- start:19153 stop:20820 length:1668 start_codon:yes stop_codon:yes gene_type:complete
MVIIDLIQQAFGFIVPLAILLGLLIFVHELGHFSVAKFFGVRVETFSIGFGKKIWERTKGDTTYCLSLIPFGGYVKMYGDDPTADIPESEKQYSFLHKSVWQRIGVVLAGPLMNFFFAILVFALIALVGEDKPIAKVGEIQPGTAAHIMGLQAGDEILKVNGKSVSLMEEVQSLVEKNANAKITMTIKRHGSEQEMELQGETLIVENPNILSTEKMVGSLEGLQFMPTASMVGIDQPDSIAAQKGLATGSLITEVDGVKLQRWYELEYLMNKAISENKSFTLKFKVDQNAEEQSVQLNAQEDAFKNLKEFGIHPLDLFVGSVVDESAAKAAGLQKNDHITAIDGNEISHWSELVNRVRAYEEDKQPLALKVVRAGEELNMEMSPKPVLQKDPVTGMEKKVYAIGITTSLMGAPPVLTLVRSSNVLEVIKRGFVDSYNWSVTTVLSFWKLLTNQVSAKSIGGPLMIGQLASQSMAVGLSAFLKIMGIISINLFILNLLPLPVLDGGHLLFYTIEVIRGKPVSMRVLEVAQTFGLVLLLSLMVFATYNDFARFLGFL